MPNTSYTPYELNDEQIVKDIINDYVNRNASFTAYTITNKARANHVERAHRTIKRTVKDMWQSGEIAGYNRTLVEISGGDKTLLYHPYDIDPDDALEFMVRKGERNVPYNTEEEEENG